MHFIYVVVMHFTYVTGSAKTLHSRTSNFLSLTRCNLSFVKGSDLKITPHIFLSLLCSIQKFQSDLICKFKVMACQSCKIGCA